MSGSENKEKVDRLLGELQKNYGDAITLELVGELIARLSAGGGRKNLTPATERVFLEIEGLARFIEDAKAEIAALRPDEVTEEYLPSAAKRTGCHRCGDGRCDEHHHGRGGKARKRHGRGRPGALEGAGGSLDHDLRGVQLPGHHRSANQQGRQDARGDRSQGFGPWSTRSATKSPASRRPYPRKSRSRKRRRATRTCCRGRNWRGRASPRTRSTACLPSSTSFRHFRAAPGSAPLRFPSQSFDSTPLGSSSFFLVPVAGFSSQSAVGCRISGIGSGNEKSVVVFCKRR